ncbi:hypothetical protein [Bradyrhizobium ottawaense]|uniref:hypothetical protein n=1 Tax=Bradyrhizobium ottawaense TaxID=931866 RepID=UPI0030F43377
MGAAAGLVNAALVSTLDGDRLALAQHASVTAPTLNCIEFARVQDGVAFDQAKREPMPCLSAWLSLLM